MSDPRCSVFFVGIEIGPEFSGYEFSSRYDIELGLRNMSTTTWSDRTMLHMSKCPTAILLDRNGEKVAFGFEAEKIFCELLQDDKHDSYYYFKHFRDDLNQREGNHMLKDFSGKPLEALTVISQTIGYFKHIAINMIQKSLMNTLVAEDFYFVLTVPAIWDDKQKDLMKKSAIMAGINENKVWIAKESDAVSLFHLRTCSTDVKKRIREGEKYMVIDLGGITTVTCHKKCQNEITEEIIAPSEGPWGQKSIDEAFYTFLCFICGREIMESFILQDSYDYINLFRNFERTIRRKVVFEGKKQLVLDRRNGIRLPITLVELVNQKHLQFEKAIELSPYKKTVTYVQGKLHIAYDTYRGLFEPTFHAIIKHIEKMQKNPKVGDINILMMTGVCSKWFVLQDFFKKYFGPSKSVLFHDQAGRAFMIGAVLLGFEFKDNMDKKDALLSQDLRGLGLENVSDLNMLLNDSSQKSYWNRIYLVGPYNVGKTCLAKILVDETLPKTRQSTDGIWIYMGRAGMDVDKLEWVFFPKGNVIKEVMTNMLLSMAIEDTKSFTNDSDRRNEKVPTRFKNNSTHIDDKAAHLHDDKTEIDKGVSLRRDYTITASKSQKVDTTNPKSLSTKRAGNKSESIAFKSSDGNTPNLPSAEKTSFKTKQKGISIPSLEQPPDVFKTGFEKLTENQEIKQLSEKTETNPNNLAVTHDLECEWLEEIITDMSNDKIHQLLVKAVQEGKYKQRIVPIDIWDFGGQKDYYMTHQLFITSRGIFVLMFDGSIDIHKNMPDLCFLPGHFGKPTVAVYLLHWVNSILTYCSRSKDGFPKIIFVATHKDAKWFDWTKETRRGKLEKDLHSLFKTHAGLDHLEFDPLIFVDATNPGDQEIAKLRSVLMQRAIEHPRWGEAMPTKWIPLELQLAQKSEEGMSIISRDQLKQLNSRNEDMVLSEKQLETFLKVHHSLGKLLYFDVGRLRDFIIISPAYLVEVLRSIVTERQFWPKEEIYSTIFKELQKNGRIERDAIFRLWHQKMFRHILPYKEYMLEILVHLDVIIAPSSSFEDITSSVQDVPSFLVPCMINKSNDTNFLGRFWKSNNSIILAYTFIEQVIPPALAYRFINSFVSGWKIKMYKEGNKTTQMLFSDLTVIELDSCHDVAVQVKENRVIVSLIHAKTKDDIIPTLASSLQECLTVAIERISEFYSTLSEDASSQGRNHVVPFNIEFGVFCRSDLCFLNHKEMQSSIWICNKHKQHHPVKYLSVWFSEKIHQGPFNICVSSCPGLGKLEKEQSPLPQHIRRIASQISPEKCHDVALELGLSESEWNDLEYQFQHQPPNDLKFMALWSCMLKRRHVTFDHLKDVLKNSELSGHLLCQVFRDVIPDIPENSKESLHKIPSFNLLHELCNHIGTRIMQIAIELDIDIPTLQRIQQEHDKKPLEQTKEVFRRWRQRSSPKPTLLGLLKALDRIGIFGTTSSVVLQFAQE